MTFCDEPKTGEHGGTISAYTAAPIARDIIARAAPILESNPASETATRPCWCLIKRERIHGSIREGRTDREGEKYIR